MSYKAVFFDIDGTLVNEEKRIPMDTKEAVEHLKSKGIDVFISTGRAPSQFKSVAEEIGIDSFVTCNGGYAEYKGTPVYGQPIARGLLKSLSAYARQHGHALVYAGSQSCYASQPAHPYVREAFDYLNVTEKPEFSPDAWMHTDIYQVYLYCEAPEETPYMEAFPEFRFIRAHRLYLDLFPNHVSKAGGMDAMLQYLGLTPDEVAAFGDGMNDIQMLSFAGMGIAMGNAREEVKAHAQFTTRSVDDGGIQYGLKKIGLL